MKLKLAVIVLLAVFTLNSCTKEKSAYFDAILKTENGMFRGIDIGNSIENVKQTENIEYLVDNMPDYLYFDYQLDMGNSYTVSYDFSDNQLYEIEVSAYFDVIEDANTVFNDFSAHFTQKYGKGKVADDGYTAWKTKDENDKNIEIAMVNDSQDYGYLSILISDLDY